VSQLQLTTILVDKLSLPKGGGVSNQMSLKPHVWQDPSLPRRPQKMKPNLIKVDISKQETQKRTHSCHFPATSCGRLGEELFVYRWRWKLSPHRPPKIQIPHSNKPIKERLLLALHSLKIVNTGEKRDDVISSFLPRKRESP
jgi:hypothetical protein